MNRSFLSHRLILMATALVLLLTGSAVAGSFPTEVTAVQYDDVVYVRWYDNHGDNDAVSPFAAGSSFEVAYRLAGSAAWQVHTTTKWTWAQFTSPTPGENYEFRVTQLDSDGTVVAVSNPHEFAAPALTNSQGENLNLSIVSLTADEFPIIYLRAQVDSAGDGIFGLNNDNFTIHENGVEQDSMFEVYPPESGLSVADVVFVFDATGSMSGVITALIANTQLFADSLVAAGIDFRIGLVVYYDHVVMYNSGNLVPPDSLHIFRGWINGLRASGGADRPENGFDALDAATTMNFRPAAQKFFIVVTDQAAHFYRDTECPGTCSGNGFYTEHTQESIVDLLVANDVTCYVVGPDLGYIGGYCGGCYDWQYHGDPMSLTDATGGRWYSIMADFRGIVEDMVGYWSSQYLVRYHTSNPFCDGVTREVELQVQDFGESHIDTAWYVPCMRPIVIVTDYTRAFEVSPQPFNTPLTIDAWVIDNVAPFPTIVKIFYRTTGGSGYSEAPMWHVSDSLWRFELPGSAVVNPGVDYYVTATDGITTGSAPSSDPSVYPYQIAVLPNEAPVITHTPIDSCINRNVEVMVTANVADITEYITGVQLCYRPYGSILYECIAMTESGSTYSGLIPAEVNSTFGFEYYIRAVDNYGVAAYDGDPDFPHLVNTGDCGNVQDVWCDDFESYSLNSIGSPNWIDGGGNTSGVSVNNSISYSGSQSYRMFGLIGGCWGAITYRSLQVTYPFTIELSVMNGTENLYGCHPSHASMEFKMGTHWSNSGVPGGFSFNNNGDFLPNGGTAVPGFALDTWHHVKGEYTTPGDGLLHIKYWVNSQFIGEFTFPEPAALPLYVGIAAQEGTVWFDDVCVKRGVTDYSPYKPSLAVVPNDCNTVINARPFYEVIVDAPHTETRTKLVGFGDVIVSAIMGTSDFDVREIDVTTLKLQGMSTIISDTVMDIGTASLVGAELCDCNTLGPDGYPDLVFEINSPFFILAPDSVGYGDVLEMKAEFLLLDSTSMTLSDCVLLEKGGRFSGSSTLTEVTTEVTLESNFPNPFNPSTVIQFSMPEASYVVLDIFNITGQKITTLIDATLEAGHHAIEWDGSHVASGIYLYRIKVGDVSISKKMLLLK